MPNLPMHTVNLPGIDNPIELVDKQNREDLATLEQEVIAITPPENIDISSDGVKVMSDYDLNELGWGVQDDDYYFTTAAEFSLGDRTYTKENAKPALGAVVGTPDGMNNRQIVLVSTDAEATYFDWGSYHNRQGISFTYLGHTWYYSGGNAAYYGTPASGIGVIDDDTLSLEDAAKYLIDVSVVYFDDGVFSAITEPNSGYLLAGGGSQADYSDAKFTVSKTGIVTAVDIVVNTESLPIAIHRVRDNECKAYYASSTYNTGDRVIYLNQYYKCKEDGVTGAWNYSKWEAWTLDKEIESVREEVANLPNPMIFKGTLGTSGTIQDLPTASSANEGFTYKVIEDGTYGSVSAKAGDVFVSNGSVWILIPAGDDVEDTWRNVKVNGVEKLTSLISSGAIDFINGTNTEVVFDENNNTLQINATDTTYPTLSQEDATAGVSETASTITAKVLKTTVDDAIADMSVTKTATGNPIELTDAADVPMVQCSTAITGSQNLHGYDKPWVGGAGKNKLPLKLDEIKTINTMGTWNGNVYDRGGVLFTILTDDGGNVTGIKTNGTSSVLIVFALYDSANLGSDPLILNGCPANGSDNTYQIQMYNVTDSTYAGLGGDYGSGFEFTPDSSKLYRSEIVIRVNQNVDNKIFYPMIRFASVADSTFEPWSNICPITSYTDGEIDVIGKNRAVLSDDYKSQSQNSTVTYDGVNGLTITATGTYARAGYLYHVENGSYTVSCKGRKTDASQYGIVRINNKEEWGSGYIFELTTSDAEYSRTIDIETGLLFIGFYSTSNQTVGSEIISQFQIEKASFATTYEPTKFTSYTTQFTKDIYQGSADYVGGNAECEMQVIDLGTLTWLVSSDAVYATITGLKRPSSQNVLLNAVCSSYEIKSQAGAPVVSYTCISGLNWLDGIQIWHTPWTTSDEAKAALSGVKFAYEIQTPTTEQLTITNAPVKSLNGYNHIDSTTGNLNIEYVTQSQQPIIDITEDYADKVSEEAASNLIDDTTTSETKVWSSNKTSNAISNAVDNISIDDLTDAEITNPANGDNLIYNGTKWVNTEPKTVIKTITGNPIEISDSASAPLVKCVTAITGSQDLHGYDKPWVGGAGKNKLDKDGYVYTDPKTNTAVNIGTLNVKSGVTYTISCVQDSALTEANRNTLMCNVNGGDIYENASSGYHKEAGLHTLTFTANSDQLATVRFWNHDCSPTITYSHFMVEIGSTATPFEPYSNICPITAYTEGEINVYGVNIFDGGFEQGTYNATTGEKEASGAATYRSINPILVVPNTQYYFYCDTPIAQGDAMSVMVCEYDINGDYIGHFYKYNYSFGFTVGTKTRYIEFRNYNSHYASVSDVGNTCINLFDTSRNGTYVPYVVTTHTTTFPSAIYRGSEDVVNGSAKCDYIKISLDGTQGNFSLIESGRINIDNFTTDNYLHEVDKLNYITNLYECLKQTGSNQDFSTLASGKDCVCNLSSNTISVALRIKDARFTDVATAKSILANEPLEIAYELATPTTKTITPTNLPIKSLFGYNHIESSTGDMEVEYITQDYQPLVDLIEANSGKHVYSTDEQVVGTWIDGSTVYEKTFDLSSSVTISRDNWTSTGVASGDIDFVIDVNAYSSNGIRWGGVSVLIADSLIKMETCRNSNGGDISVKTFTLQYTKATQTRSLSKSAPIEDLSSEEEKSLKTDENVVKTNDTEPEVKETIEEEQR